MSRRRSNGFDNTSITLSFSRQEGEQGAYFRCIPDMDMDVNFNLSDCHLVFYPDSMELRITKNRNAL